MQQFIGFNVNSSEYMVPILKVREIISMPDITALPHLPDYVKGISNLRGSIIPIVNLKTLLNSSNGEDAGTIVIVIATGKIIFGIIVDGITGVVKVDESSIEPPEKFINNDVDRIDGVAKLDDKLIVLLNTSKLLPLDDMTLLEEAIVEVSDSADEGKVEVVKEIDTIGGKVTVKELRDAKDFMGDKLDDTDPKNNIFNMMLDSSTLTTPVMPSTMIPNIIFPVAITITILPASSLLDDSRRVLRFTIGIIDPLRLLIPFTYAGK